MTITFQNYPWLSLSDIDLIHAPNAARTGVWPENMDVVFKKKTIQDQQDLWEKYHKARAADHNCFVLLNNAVGSATVGFEDVVANHAWGGTRALVFFTRQLFWY